MLNGSLHILKLEQTLTLAAPSSPLLAVLTKDHPLGEKINVCKVLVTNFLAILIYPRLLTARENLFHFPYDHTGSIGSSGLASVESILRTTLSKL